MFLYSAFHIVSMRFTRADGGLLRAAYEGTHDSRAAYNHDELVRYVVYLQEQYCDILRYKI